MQLGRYQILKQLATGGVADVLLARATGLEGFARHVVIKRIRPELTREERLVEAFLDEARIAASLHHQNIVQVHDIGEQGGSYFFAMEYVHGEDVRKLLSKVRERGQQVPFDYVVAIITATAAGLHHAHEQRNPSGEALGLVHRDVSPANILIGYDGSVKLVDFGMARAGLRSTKTASGTLRGKASYLSPEQCVGRDVDRRTDTFALGIVLYELVTASRLFKGASDFLTMAAVVEGQIPAPSTIRPEIPPALDAIVLRALARAPESRYQTAEQLREALERFAVEYELRTSNKSLADYLISLFGQRPEPWQADVELIPSQEIDLTLGKGLVAAPPDQDVIERYAPRATSPIMLAQALAVAAAEDPNETQVGKLPPEFDELRERRADENPTQQTPTADKPTELSVDDAWSPTVITPPVAEVEPPPVAEVEAPPVVEVKPPRVAAVEPPPVAEADTPAFDSERPTVVDAELAERVATEVRASVASGKRSAEQPAVVAEQPSVVAPIESAREAPVPAGEQLYVGPPATSRVRAFLRLYGRSIAIGAGAGVLVVVAAALAFRACSPAAHATRARSAPMSQPAEPSAR